MRLTWMYHVVHNTCTMHGRDIKTRKIGSTSILQLRKDWHSVRLDRMQSSFKKHFQLIVFQKFLDWKLEMSYRKKYTCHLDLGQRSRWSTNGKRELGSEVARQPEGEVARQAKFFQLTQPTPNPIREQIGATWWHGRWKKHVPFPGDQCIFFEELSSSDRTERLVETKTIQTRSSADNKTQCWADSWQNGRPWCYSSFGWSTKQLLNTFFSWKRYVQRWRWRTSNGKSIAVHDESHEPMMVNDADMDFRIPGLPYSVANTHKVPAFDHWFRKLRTIQIDMLFNKIYDRINHLILPVENQNKRFRMLGRKKHVNYLRQNPKRSALYVGHTGILVHSSGHFLHKERGTNQQFTNCTMDLLSVLEYVIKKGRPHGHRYGKKPGDKEFETANQLKKRCKKKYFQRIHDRFTRDPEIRNRMIEIIETKKFVDDGMLLRKKIILTIWPHTLSLFKSKWWLHSNLIPCHWRKDLISSKHCLPCNDWNKKQKETHKCLLQQKSTMCTELYFFYNGGIGKVHGGLFILLKVTMEMHLVVTERGDLLNAVFVRFFWTSLSWTQFTLWQMSRLQLAAVYRNRHNTSNGPFSRCKSVQWLQERIDDQHTVWLQVQKWTKNENSMLVRGDIARLHDRHQWRQPWLSSTQSTSTRTLEYEVLCLCLRLFCWTMSLSCLHGFTANRSAPVVTVFLATNLLDRNTVDVWIMPCGRISVTTCIRTFWNGCFDWWLKQLLVCFCPTQSSLLPWHRCQHCLLALLWTSLSWASSSLLRRTKLCVEVVLDYWWSFFM